MGALPIKQINISFDSRIGFSPSSGNYGTRKFGVLVGSRNYWQKFVDIDDHNCFAADDRSWGVKVSEYRTYSACLKCYKKK